MVGTGLRSEDFNLRFCFESFLGDFICGRGIMVGGSMVGLFRWRGVFVRDDKLVLERGV